MRKAWLDPYLKSVVLENPFEVNMLKVRKYL